MTILPISPSCSILRYPMSQIRPFANTDKMLPNNVVFTIFLGILIFILSQTIIFLSKFISLKRIGFLSVYGCRVRLQNTVFYAEKISLNISPSGIRLALHEVNLQLEPSSGSSSSLNDSTLKSLERQAKIFNLIFALTPARWILTWINVSAHLVSISITKNAESIIVALIQELSVIPSFMDPQLNSEGLTYLFGSTFNRVFGCHMIIEKSALRSKNMSRIVDIPEEISLSLVWADGGDGRVKVGVLGILKQLELDVASLDFEQLKSLSNQSKDPAENLKDDLAEHLASSVKKQIAQIYPLTLFCQSFALLLSNITVNIPVNNLKSILKAKLVMQKMSVIVAGSAPTKSELHGSLNIKIDDALLLIGSFSKPLCKTSSLSSWNQVRLYDIAPVYPAFLPALVTFESFLTLHDPILQADDSMIMDLVDLSPVNAKRDKSSNPQANAIALSRLFQGSCKINLVNFDANVCMIDLSSTEQIFKTSVWGEQLSITISSLPTDVDTNIPDVILNFVMEHKSVSLTTLIESKSPFRSGFKNPTNPLIVLPSSNLSMALNGENTIDCSLSIQSLALDLSSIARDLSSYDSLVLKILDRVKNVQLKAAEMDIGQEKKNNLAFLEAFKIRAQCHLDAITITLSTSSEPYHSFIIFGKRAQAKFIIENGISSHFELGEFLLNSAPKNCAIENFLIIKSLVVKQKSLDSIVQCSSKDIDFHIDLSKIYVMIKSLSFILHLDNIRRDALGQNPVKPPSASKKNAKLAMKIPLIQLHVVLPNDVRGLGAMHGVDVTFESALDLDIKSFTSSIFKEDRKQMYDLASLDQVRIEVIPPSDTDPMLFSLVSKVSRLIVPNDWPFSNIMENGVNLSRILKTLVYECLEKEPIQYYASGKTFFDPLDTPTFIVKSMETEIILEDNAFESLLGRNYVLGYSENLSRLSREKEFMKIARTKFPFMTNTEYVDLKDSLRMHIKAEGTLEEEVFKAWTLMETYNSNAYIQRIKSVKDLPAPKLMVTKLSNLEVIATVPLCESSLENTLHEMDENTPPDLIYEDFIARNIKLSVTGMEFRLRDYPNPLLYLPSKPGTKLVMEGLVVIADPSGPPESRRLVQVSLDFDDETFLNTTRSVNPTKVYMQTHTEISTNSILQVCLGAPYEPCMADVINVIDNFTKPSDDPSPPVGWWDKLRIIIHGTNTMTLRGGGGISFLALGSTSPYFDPRIHFGVEGTEWVMSNGLELVFGGKSENSSSVSMAVECGELKVNFKRSRKYASPEEQSVCFAKLTGGVTLLLKCDFVTASPVDPTVFINPWRKHYEVSMLTSETFRRNSVLDTGISKDSYFGFRSDFINVTVEVKSPRQYYSGLANPQNCFFFNTETFDGISKMILIYQSLLTNVPVRRGNLFNSINILNKPKLGRCISSVHLNMAYMPLMLSFLFDCENGTESVGLRLRATQVDFDAHFTQYSVKLITESILERKPVTKWIRETNTISFLNIEGKVLSYCGKDSDLYIPQNDYTSERKNWIFQEDSFPDLSDLSLLSCIWAPKLDVIAMEKQTPESEIAAKKAIMMVQYELYQNRLEEIEAEIARYKESRSLSKSRGAVFFDDAYISDFSQELSTLQEKRQVLIYSLEYCKRVIDGEDESSKGNASHVFNSKYVVHNLKLLWNVPVRNIIFRMAEIETKNRFLGFCLSNAAAQVAAELVDTIAKQQDELFQRRRNTHVLLTRSGVQDLLESFLEDLSQGGKPVTVPCEVGSINEAPNFKKGENSPQSPTVKNEDDNCEDHQFLENDVVVRFLNPQIYFEIEGDIPNSAIVLSTTKMQVKYLMVLDSVQGQFDKDRQDSIVQFRNVWSLEDAQFLVQESKSLSTGKYSWLPLESIVNQNLPVAHYGRVIDHAQVIFKTEKPNPLYTQRSNSNHTSEIPTTFHLQIPVLRCSATSKQYVTFYDLFKNLLVYRDPASGERSDRLKNTLFSLEYSDDLEQYRFTVLALQEKIRQTEFLLKYQKRQGRNLTPLELLELRRSWIDYRNDLFVLMESLQNLQNIELKRKSLNISWQLFVNIDEFLWLLMQDDETSLCRWVIESLFFGWISNEDQSNVNTLEIDQTKVENLSPIINMFKDVISTYNTDGREINFEKQKMIRIYWRESAPVGGIQVVAHFEVNIQPLLIQVTYEFGKQVSKYFFPHLVKRKEILAPSTTTTPIDSSRRESEKILDITRKEPQSSVTSIDRFGSRSTVGSGSNKDTDQIRQMQERANQIKSFIYIKVPGVKHCLSYRGLKEKNFEDLTMFPFFLPTLEYRNKTWTWLDFLNAIKKDALRAALVNTGALVREKFFSKRPTSALSIDGEPHSRSHSAKNLEEEPHEPNDDDRFSVHSLDSDEAAETASASTGAISIAKKKKPFVFLKIRRNDTADSNTLKSSIDKWDPTKSKHEMTDEQKARVIFGRRYPTQAIVS